MKNNIYSDRVFTSNPRRAFVKALKRADIKNLSFHSVRHTCMSYLAQMSLTPLEIIGHGRHKYIKSVTRYAHIDPLLTMRTSIKLRETFWEWVIEWRQKWRQIGCSTF